jgi:hypothetical protein
VALVGGFIKLPRFCALASATCFTEVPMGSPQWDWVSPASRAQTVSGGRSVAGGKGVAPRPWWCALVTTS